MLDVVADVLIVLRGKSLRVCALKKNMQRTFNACNELQQVVKSFTEGEAALPRQ